MTRLREIQFALDGVSEDARFSAWTKIYSDESEESRQELNAVKKSRDPLLKLKFCRFLGVVAELRAINYLVELMEDPNERILEGAVKAFERNRFDGKWGSLLSLLDSKSRKAKLYAIEKLSQAFILDALDKLIAMLNTTDEELLVNILKGLRFFADERILPHIFPFLRDERSEVRFRAYLVLGILYEEKVSETRELYLTGLKDSQPQIRRAVLWGLRRVSNTKDISHIIKMTSEDEDPLVRQEGLISLAAFPTYPVILHILKVMTEDKSPLVLLKAEGVLYGFPIAALFKHLWRVLKQEKGKVCHKALIVMAEVRILSEDFTAYLIRRLKITKEDKEKLPLIEALGIDKNPKSVPVLESYLRGNPVLGYAAMAALLKIWTDCPEVPIGCYLEDDSITPLFKQTILKQMLKSAKWNLYMKTMAETLMRLLQDENLNIRYLAAQVLTPVTREDVLDTIFKSVLSEKDPAYAKFLRDSILGQLTARPEWVKGILEDYNRDVEAVRLLFSILVTTDLFGKRMLVLLGAMLREPIVIHQSPYQGMFKVFLGAILKKRRIEVKELLEYLWDVPNREIFLNVLVSVLKSENIESVAIPVPLLEEWYDQESAPGRQAITNLLGYSCDTGALVFLIKILCHSETEAYQQAAKEAVGRISESFYD